MTAKEDRKPGRPRDDTVDEAIIDATLELLAEVGMAGLSIEGIVARAGVSKAALYRRWDSKETLVIDAVVAKVERTSFEESGEIRKDLLAILEIFGHFVSGTKAGFRLMGMPMGDPRPPRLPLPTAEVPQLAAVLRGMGLGGEDGRAAAAE